MKSTLTIGEQLQLLINKARKHYNQLKWSLPPDNPMREDARLRLQYYSDIANSGNVVAFVEWDTFRGSWAGEEWIKRNA